MLSNLLKTCEKLMPDEFEILVHYQNLFKTWERLASDEFGFENGYSCLKNMNPVFKFMPYPFMTDLASACLQSCIQRCIEARNEWDWMVVSGQNYAPKIYDAIVYLDGSEFTVEGKSSAVEALLTAYLSALAAQRSPNSGAWQHFKGGTVFVKTTAKWSGDTRNPDSFAETYQVEESPEIKLQPRLLSGSEDRWVYDGPKDYGDRVFYSDRSGRWARETSVFLSLVGSNQEHQGKLRFTEVSHAKA